MLDEPLTKEKMPTATTCIYDGKSISIQKALRLKESEKAPIFFCNNCGERVKPHKSGGDTAAHFEHFSRNPACPNSHSDSYQYGGSAITSFANTDSISAIEGYRKERRYLSKARNSRLVVECKKRDKNQCKACGYKVAINGRSIIECHHINPLGLTNETVTCLEDLVCLCPNCHRIAHTENPPMSVKQIKKVLKSAKTSR